MERARNGAAAASEVVTQPLSEKVPQPGAALHHGGRSRQHQHAHRLSAMPALAELKPAE